LQRAVSDTHRKDFADATNRGEARTPHIRDM
jgi:hypothetical protein